MTISRELAAGVGSVTASVSHECIYQAVYAHGQRGLRAGLHEGRHRRRRCRKHRTPGPVPAKASPLGGEGTDLAIYTPADLRRIEQRLNTMPRRSLNRSSAADVHHAAVAMTG